jgi:hypothetical protein
MGAAVANEMKLTKHSGTLHRALLYQRIHAGEEPMKAIQAIPK